MNNPQPTEIELMRTLNPTKADQLIAALAESRRLIKEDAFRFTQCVGLMELLVIEPILDSLGFTEAYRQRKDHNTMILSSRSQPFAEIQLYNLESNLQPPSNVYQNNAAYRKRFASANTPNHLFLTTGGLWIHVTNELNIHPEIMSLNNAASFYDLFVAGIANQNNI